MISVEVRSSGEKSGSVWMCRDSRPTVLIKVLADEAGARRHRDGVAVIIRRETK